MDYIGHGVAELDTTERLSLSLSNISIQVFKANKFSFLMNINLEVALPHHKVSVRSY